jgi:tetratricopeptide (TPR) repeat protein
MKLTHEHAQACCAPELGALLFEYELGTLSDTDRQKFERHLMECDFCLYEAAEYRQLSDALIANRSEVVSAFEKEGVTVESLLEQSADKPKQQQIEREIRAENSPRVFSWQNLFGPKTAIAFAAAAAIVLILGLSLFKEKPTLMIGAYAPPSWLTWQSRGLESADSLLKSAQASYNAKDFSAASKSLSKYLASHGDAQASLYLGVAYYELGHFEQAIQAFEWAKADNSVIRAEADFYRSLILLKQGNRSGAVEILKQVVAENSNRVGEAKDLLKQIEESRE